LDPRPNLPSIVEMVEKGFELSEASHTPVMLELRVRACHVYGRFTAKDNQKPSFRLREAMENPQRDVNRIVLPPANFQHEQEKIHQRWPAAVDFIKKHHLNEFLGSEEGDVAIIVQGGLYNTLIRALELEGLSDCFGNAQLPIYCLNVTYPLIEDEVVGFCADKRSVLIVEEGQPEYIEQALNHILRRKDLQTKVVGKDVLPMAGEYTGEVVRRGVERFMAAYSGRADWPETGTGHNVPAASSAAPEELQGIVPGRPAGFCTGCPERPVFSAMKLLEKEMGPFHISGDIGCHLFSILPPFNLGNTTMGYGLGWSGASAFNTETDKRTISVMGDGGFWHNGLASGVGNAVFNKNDNVLVVIDNNYSAATGGQDIPSSRMARESKSGNHPIEQAVKGVGVDWVQTVGSYDIDTMRETLHEALTTEEKGPKVIIAQGECMLNRQRREKPIRKKQLNAGKRVVRERFGIDPDTCTGDHSCIRLSGCPSLTIADNPDPLREDPVAKVDDSCVGCGVCGEVAHAAVLCPSFYRADVVYNPTRRDRLAAKLRRGVIGFFQKRAEAARARHAF